MTALICSARTCLYNQDEYCSKGEIKIGGESAKNAEQTCCASFEERTGDPYRNSVGSPSASIEICCEACNCVYNEDERCHATQIGVAGASACDCEETACGTFACK